MELNLTASVGTELIDSLEQELARGFEMRRTLVRVHNELADLQSKSLLREVAFGAAGNKDAGTWPSADLRVVPGARKPDGDRPFSN